jgi:hypothetical protein
MIPPQGVASIFLETGSTNWALHDLYSKFSCTATSGRLKLYQPSNSLILRGNSTYLFASSARLRGFRPLDRIPGFGNTRMAQCIDADRVDQTGWPSFQ